MYKFYKGNIVRSFKFLLCIILLIVTQIYAYESNYPIYLRLKFKNATDSVSYLWERKVLSIDTIWAMQSYDGKEWEPVPELPRRVKVGVALAGGFVRGIAHIGVLKAFEENNIPIHGIAGTSIGAIVGGLYASGYSISTLEWIIKNDIDWKTFFSDIPPRRYLPIWERLREKPREPGLDLNLTGGLWPPLRYTPGIGIRVAQKFTDEILKLTLEADFQAGFKFDNLPIPFGAVLTDMKAGKSKLMREGTLSTALRASGSVPIIFEPMEIGGIPYVDGGVLNDLPVDAFIPFDTIRAPENMMNIIGKDTINYVIAVYPSKIRRFRAKTEEQKFYGPVGLGMLYELFFMVRDYSIWSSWNAADGKIDMNVKGGFNFSNKKIDEMILAGYDATMGEIFQIKREIAAKEEHERPSSEKKKIHQISSIKLFNIIENDTIKLEQALVRERIYGAIRIKEGSYVEKIDICDVLKRIYNLGDFEDVQVKIDNIDNNWELSFFLKSKEDYKNSLKVFVRMDSISVCDSFVDKIIKEDIRRKKRALNFNETKELVETGLIGRGFVAPHIDSVKFCPSELNDDTLHIYVNKGTRISGVKIRCEDEEMKEDLENEFSTPLNPWKVLGQTEYVYKEFQLKSIAVEGLKRDSLVISVRKKSTHTLEFPSLSYEMFEGLNFFAELRSRRMRRFLNWSYYMNYTQNFPLKLSRELPQGHKVSVGLKRFRSIPIAPDVSLSWRRLMYPEEPDMSVYDLQFEEVSGQLTLPIYLDNFAYIPGLEISKTSTFKINEDRQWQGGVNGFIRLRYDNLDRLIFPESGWKADFDVKFGIASSTWARTRVRILGVPLKYRIQNKLTTTFIMNLYSSWYSEGSPDHERYSLGGITPVGSYQLRLIDYEDLPGYRKDEFIKPLMWKAGGTARLTLMEMSVLGLQANVHLEGSIYIADAIPRGDPLFESSRFKISPLGAIYLDTSFLNVGFGVKGTHKKFLHHFYLSVVLYGLGF